MTMSVAPLGHKWNKGEVTIAPACTEAGEKTFSCKRDGCSETRKEELLPLGHDWDDGKVTKEATTSQDGVMTYTCNRCKDTMNGIIPMPEQNDKDEQTATVGGNTYEVTSASAKTVAFTKAKKIKKTVTVPATVTVNGVKYNVTSIASKAFKGTRVKTLIVKSRKLTKKSVKGSLKGSEIKTVKVGKKKTNKKYVKKYKKCFTKKNCGKKVRVTG